METGWNKAEGTKGILKFSCQTVELPTIIYILNPVWKLFKSDGKLEEGDQTCTSRAWIATFLVIYLP